MKKLLTAVLVLATVSMAAQAGTAYLKDSYVSGANRVCVYSSVNGDFVITIKSYQICQASIGI